MYKIIYNKFTYSVFYVNECTKIIYVQNYIYMYIINKQSFFYTHLFLFFTKYFCFDDIYKKNGTKNVTSFSQLSQKM